MSKNKRKELKQLAWGLLVGAGIPLVLIKDEVDFHIHAILKEIIDGIAEVGIQFAVEEPSDQERKHEWKIVKQKHPKWITIIQREESKANVFDITILEELTADRLKQLRDHRMVPVAEKGVQTFDPIEEKGNGFLYHQNPWSLFAALVRAQETYRFPYDWENLIKAVERDARVSCLF